VGDAAATGWNPDDPWTLLLVIAVGVLAGILKEALQARAADRPWFGFDLRRWRRVPRDGPDRRP
jgi:hypothetical protein